MKRTSSGFALWFVAFLFVSVPAIAQRDPSPVRITAADCNAARLGTDAPVGIPSGLIPLVRWAAPKWTAAVDGLPAICSVDGEISRDGTVTGASVSGSTTGRFRVLMPELWMGTVVQCGSFVGTDSAFPRGRTRVVGSVPAVVATFGATVDYAGDEKTVPLDDQVYRQLEKTYAPASLLMQRMYGRRSAFHYTGVPGAAGDRLGHTIDCNGGLGGGLG